MKTFICDLPENEINGHCSRVERDFEPQTIDKVLCQEIGKAQALSTDAACEKLGRALGIIEQQWTTVEFKRFVYGRLRWLERRFHDLTSARVWNGKGYQRIWRRS